MSRFLVLPLLFAVFATLDAAPINLGIVSYDAPAPGVNAFSLLNLTNATPCGVPCVLSDFPVTDNVLFQNVWLTVILDGIVPTSETHNLAGSVGAGSVTPVEWQFPDTTLIRSAVLILELSTGSVTLEDGTVLSGLLTNLTVDLLPGSGNLLTAGQDLAVIATQAIPEPASYFLVGTGLTLAAVRRRLF